MIILFGTSNKEQDAGGGMFQCPACRQRQRYAVKQVRRYFTLFFIPVLPLDQQGRYVECQGCGAKLDPRVID
jgi:DNA-directed RNA polymerase subunit RPC12/RpoP